MWCTGLFIGMNQWLNKGGIPHSHITNYIHAPSKKESPFCSVSANGLTIPKTKTKPQRANIFPLTNAMQKQRQRSSL